MGRKNYKERREQYLKDRFNTIAGKVSMMAIRDHNFNKLIATGVVVAEPEQEFEPVEEFV